ncbi:leucine-rich repeat-containing protein 19-like [Pholidichthys leucotaenia]
MFVQAIKLVKNLTNKLLQVIPHNDNAPITTLVIGENLITLNETDRLALASYPALEELCLDGNRVTAIPANYFSVVPNLRVLSLGRNSISRLDSEAFSGLGFLTQLDLSHNLMTSLPQCLTRGMNNLSMLNLEDNPWNCSCLQLRSIMEITAAKITIGPQAVCASPADVTGCDLKTVSAQCLSSTPPPMTTAPHKPQTMANSHQPGVPSIAPKIMLSSSQNHNLGKDQTPVLGNSWKFTVSIAALGLTTSMLIVCAIKGPSWYKLFHNYRHRRLRQDSEEDEEDTVSTVFRETGRYMSQHTYSFEEQNGQIDEGEDDEEEEYFEDPYINREDMRRFQKNHKEANSQSITRY